jgi:hypothetical protein
MPTKRNISVRRALPETIFYPGEAEQFLESVLKNPEKFCPDARGIILRRLAILKRLAVPLNVTVRLSRSNSNLPTSRRICWLTVDCDRCTRSAAREKLFVCATATKLRRGSGGRLFIKIASRSQSITL